MSVKLANSVSELLKYNTSEVLAIPQGPIQTLWTNQQATSYNPAGQTHTIQMPSPTTSLDRRMYLKNKLRLTFTGSTPDGSNLLKSGYDAPRAFPVMSSVNTMQLSINNSTITSYHQQTLQAYLRIGETVAFADAWSLAPTMLDKQQNYNDSLNVNPAFEDLVGNDNNSLSKGPKDVNGQRPRGNSWFEVISNGPSEAVVILTTFEPLLMSPFTATDGSDALVGIDRIQLTINFQNPTRFWSHNAMAANQSKNMTYTWAYEEAPALYYQQFVNPEAGLIPAALTFPYSTHSYITNPIADAFDTPNDVRTITTQSYNLNRIPDAIYVYAERTPTYQHMSDTNTYALIESIEFQFDTQSAMNTGLVPEQQWIISRDSGVAGTFQDQSQNTGTIVRVIPGITFPLADPSLAPGVLGNHTITMKVTIRNIDRNTYSGNPSTQPLTAPRKWNLVTIYQNKELITISPNRMDISGPLLTEETVLEARDAGLVVESNDPTDTSMRAGGCGATCGRNMPIGYMKMVGGKNTWKKIARIGKSAWKGAKKLGLHKPVQRVANRLLDAGVQGLNRIADRGVGLIDAAVGPTGGYYGGGEAAPANPVRPSQSLPAWSSHVGGAMVSREELQETAAAGPSGGSSAPTPIDTSNMYRPVIANDLGDDMMSFENPF